MAELLLCFQNFFATSVMLRLCPVDIAFAYGDRGSVSAPCQEMQAEERGVMKMGSLACECALNRGDTGSHATSAEHCACAHIHRVDARLHGESAGHRLIQ
jgi:hypothetical protein